MSKTIKLDIVSDVVCPWCVIGYKRLEQAITELGVQYQVEIEWHPFELNPNMPQEGENLRAHLANKYGTTKEDSIRARDNLTQLGSELGFRFDYFDEMKMVNTKKAHLLLEYAKSFNKQTELKMALFEAFFSQRKDVSDPQELQKLIIDTGLDADKAMAFLDDSIALRLLEQEQQHWRNLGISSVPTVVFDMKGAMTGAQPVEAYKQVITDLLAEATQE
ncbi:DsbA family oxidoreductase [Vibrio sp. SCSIO 43136]|uniref:DsbA family oxidoreductase n=1 Tax=Vibrio sp. SCSIO 43136 TaxID=2819101 RepID=UPI0020752DDB|nr:DsbA family oxidoreductase [Vibrio sp. SCSIO 43136]USD66160.1 DsbA family oxidoreductase [Vibrio sp. SCSIO 43136]